jgi:hypothetical protein
MKGKVGLVIGLGAGYVLGSRAGRERYQQIKDQFLKAWNTEPVQQQVAKVQDFAKSSVAQLPSTLWDGAQKVKNAVSKQGTPGEKLDSGIKAGKSSAEEAKRAAAEKTGTANASFDEVSGVADDDISGPNAASLPTGQI